MRDLWFVGHCKWNDCYTYGRFSENEKSGKLLQVRRKKIEFRSLLTNAWSRIVAQQPAWRAETLRLAEMPIERDATEIATATADSWNDVNFAGSMIDRWLEVNVRKFVASVGITAFAVTQLLVSGVATCIMIIIKIINKQARADKIG